MIDKPTLVLGASLKEDRYSNLIIHKLVGNNHSVYAYGLHGGIVSGVVVETELILYPDIDTVTLYLNPSHQSEYYDYIIALNPRRVIFNPGTEHSAFYKLLKTNHIDFEVACSLVLLSTNQY